MPRPPAPAAPKPERDVYSVGRLNREVRLLLERGIPMVWVEAEISNLARPASGHWYFSLKDRDAQVRCAMFRQRNLAVRFQPSEGALVLARGRVGLYEPRGDFQLIVEHLEEAGVGALHREFEKLRDRLAAEGLFAESLKRPLPAVPARVGVITSPTGAALRDILHILGRRFPAADVLIYPTAVQGAAAAGEIRAALALAATRAECDVLILARGGGSLEDLWAFNDEQLARAIRACPVPVVTGIGHEVDFTIADFAADVRAPTPSGAAQLVVPDGRSWLAGLAALGERFQRGIQRALRSDAERLANLSHRLARMDPGLRIAQSAQRLDELEQQLDSRMRLAIAAARARLDALGLRLARALPALRVQALVRREAELNARLRDAMQRRMVQSAQRLALAQRALDAVSPLAVLGRGFAILTRASDGAVLRDAGAVAAGAEVIARLGRGALRARVLGQEPGDGEGRGSGHGRSKGNDP